MKNISIFSSSYKYHFLCQRVDLDQIHCAAPLKSLPVDLSTYFSNTVVFREKTCWINEENHHRSWTRLLAGRNGSSSISFNISVSVYTSWRYGTKGVLSYLKLFLRDLHLFGKATLFRETFKIKLNSHKPSCFPFKVLIKTLLPWWPQMWGSCA